MQDIPYLGIIGSTQHTSIPKTTSTCVRRPRPKPRFVSYDNKSSFSPEHIEEKGNLYRCLICPSRGKEWKSRDLMRAHQRNSKTHERLVALAEQKEPKETTQPMPVLYYPPTSPHTSIENAIPVFYDPEVLDSRFDGGDHSSTDGSTNGTDVSPSVKEESPQLNLNAPGCVYSAHKINEHRYCIWCRMPEVPMLKYQLCRKFSPEVVKQATRGYLF